MAQVDACVAEAHSCICGSQTHLFLCSGIVGVNRGQKIVGKHLRQNSIATPRQAERLALFTTECREGVVALVTSFTRSVVN